MLGSGLPTRYRPRRHRSARRRSTQSEYLEALHETALAAISRPDASDLLETIVGRAASLVGTTHGYAYVREQEDWLRIMVGTGVFADWVDFRMPVGEGMAGEVVQSGRSMMVRDYATWQGRSPKFPPALVHAVVCVPLTSSGRVTGVIGLVHVERGRRFTDDDLGLLSKFGEIASICLDNARLYASVEQELAERRRAEEQLSFAALHDPLTGLPNRSMFERDLAEALDRAREESRAVAVLSLDLDDFKLVNDSLGHAAGDALLREAAARLRGAARAADLVARQGGDEYLILLTDLDATVEGGGALPAEGMAEAVAHRLQGELAKPFLVSGTEVYISASVGISLFPHSAQDAASLLRFADAAVYASKRTGRGRSRLTIGEADDSLHRLSAATELRRAVEKREWDLHYQPIVDLASGEVEGVEALLRWARPGGGVSVAGDFIDEVEEMGLMGPVGDWVLGEVCRQSGIWRRQGHGLFVSFNLSLAQLWQPDLAVKVLREADLAGVDPSEIVIEITETSALTDPRRTWRVLRRLREQGFRLAIDDFGTGHSSLSRLKQLPADILKIDRPFMRGVPRDPGAAGVVRAVLDLAGALGMEPVVEGIETEEQREFLVGLGCRLGQGFLFGPAVEPGLIPPVRPGSEQVALRGDAVA